MEAVGRGPCGGGGERAMWRRWGEGHVEVVGRGPCGGGGEGAMWRWWGGGHVEAVGRGPCGGGGEGAMWRWWGGGHVEVVGRGPCGGGGLRHEYVCTFSHCMTKHVLSESIANIHYNLYWVSYHKYISKSDNQ